MTIPPNPARRAIPGPFRYDGATMRKLVAAISNERFATYLRLAGGDRRRALQLYARNAALGSVFHWPIQALEITLRNAANDAMTAKDGIHWFDGPQLEQPQRDAVTAAKDKIHWKAGAQPPGRVVAELSLGFWVALFAKGYEEALWRTALYRCFDPAPARRQLHKQLNRLRRLRNRVAHHEPILSRDLQADYEAIKWVLGMLSPETAAWVEHHSRVREELARSSRTIGRF